MASLRIGVHIQTACSTHSYAVYTKKCLMCLLRTLLNELNVKLKILFNIETYSIHFYHSSLRNN